MAIAICNWVLSSDELKEMDGKEVKEVWENGKIQLDENKKFIHEINGICFKGGIKVSASGEKYIEHVGGYNNAGFPIVQKIKIITDFSKHKIFVKQ